MCSSGRWKRVFPPKQKQPTDLDNLEVTHPKNWPYTLHDTDETPFNLRHGYMWGRISGLNDL